jgi:hypothetical protein
MTVLTLSVATAIISCKKDKVSAYAKITVKENGLIKAGTPVYLFSSNKGPTTDFFKPFFASKTVITESNGIATFDLQKVYDLEVSKTQTTLYFGVFSASDSVLGTAAITIREGETKSATIAY